MNEHISEPYLLHNVWWKVRLPLGRIFATVFLLASLARADVRSLNVRITSVDGSTPVVDIAVKDEAGEEVLLKKAVQVPWQGRLKAAVGQNSSILVKAPAYWSQILSLPQSDEVLHIALFPASTLTGKIDFGDSEPPASAYLDFKLLSYQSAELPYGREAPGQENYLSGRVECTISNKVLSCRAPAGLLDARISMSDYAPEFSWRISAGREAVLWPGIKIPVRGPSIAGWIELPHGYASYHGLKVEAVPQEYASSRDERDTERTALLGRNVEVSDNGFFQIKGMKPGAHVIQAFGNELASERRELLVEEGSEDVLLDQPLTLVPPSVLEVFIEPFLDPWGGAWRMDVIRKEEISNTYATIRSVEVSLSGFVEIDAIRQGNYGIQIYDSKGSSWISKNVAVTQDFERIVIEISAVPIRGTFRIGESGTRANLIFGTRTGVVSVEVTSDEEGYFEGVLPYEDVWPIEVEVDGDSLGVQAAEPVEVRSKPGKRFAELQIELPDTTVRGKVLDGGNPADAFVLAIRELEDPISAHGGLRRRDITRKTDKDGTFLVRGISPGTLRLFAYNESKSSDWRTLLVEEGRDEGEIVLELVKKVRIDGLVARDDSTVSGARVIAFPSEGLGQETVSAPDGSFELKVPRYVKWLDFVVLPPGFPVFFHRHIVGDGNDQRIKLVTPPGSIDVVVDDISHTSYLHSRGISVSLNTLMNTLVPAGRVKGAPTGGFVIQGVEPGDWSLCPGPIYSETDCVAAVPEGASRPNFEASPKSPAESGR